MGNLHGAVSAVVCRLKSLHGLVLRPSPCSALLELLELPRALHPSGQGAWWPGWLTG